MFNKFQKFYKPDKLFYHIINALDGKFATTNVEAEKLKNLLPSFRYNNGIMYFEENFCVPRQNIREVLWLAHDSPSGGHSGFSKTLSRFDKFHLNKTFSDIKRYCDGCTICQQSKDSRQKPFGISQPLEFPARRWESVGTDFIVRLHVTERGNDEITTYIDRLAKRIYFLPTYTTATAEEIAKDFYNRKFRLHSLPESNI